MAVSVVTLLVDPEEAERLTLASTEGKIQLALRNPLDKTTPVTRGIRPAAAARIGAPTRIAVHRARPAAASPDTPVVTRAGAAGRRRSKSSAATNARTKSCARSSRSMRIRIAVVDDRLVLDAHRGGAAPGAPAAACAGPTPSTDRCSAARRPLDDRRRRHADRARVADQRRHRRRAGHVAEPAARSTARCRARSRCSSGTAPAACKRYEVVVQRDLARLTDQMKELFPGETIEAQSNGKTVVLSGTGLEQGRRRQGGQRRRRLRREGRRRRQRCSSCRKRPAEQPGAAARALRRSEPQRDDRARRRRSSPARPAIKNTIGRVDHPAVPTPASTW